MYIIDLLPRVQRTLADYKETIKLVACSTLLRDKAIVCCFKKSSSSKEGICLFLIPYAKSGVLYV